MRRPRKVPYYRRVPFVLDLHELIVGGEISFIPVPRATRRQVGDIVLLRPFSCCHLLGFKLSFTFELPEGSLEVASPSR